MDILLLGCITVYFQCSAQRAVVDLHISLMVIFKIMTNLLYCPHSALEQRDNPEIWQP